MSHYVNPLSQTPALTRMSFEVYIRLMSNGDRELREKLLDTRREAAQLWQAILAKNRREKLHIIEVQHIRDSIGSVNIIYIDPELPYKNPMRPNLDMHFLDFLFLICIDAKDVVEECSLEFTDIENYADLDHQTLRIVFK